MSNTRKATRARAPHEDHTWSKETVATPLPVRGAWPVSASRPVVWIDATGRPDVADLARAHREAPKGDASTQWGVTLTSAMDLRLLLMARFRRPVRVEFAIAFTPGHMEAVARIATTGTIAMVTGKPAVRNGRLEGRNAVTMPMDQAGLHEALEQLHTLQTMTGTIDARRSG